MHYGLVFCMFIVYFFYIHLHTDYNQIFMYLLQIISQISLDVDTNYNKTNTCFMTYSAEDVLIKDRCITIIRVTILKQ